MLAVFETLGDDDAAAAAPQVGPRAVCCVLCAVCCVLCAVCCVLCAVCCQVHGAFRTWKAAG